MWLFCILNHNWLLDGLSHISIVFIASSSSLVCILASCLPFFFDVVPYTFNNKVGNVLNNTQDQNDSND